MPAMQRLQELVQKTTAYLDERGIDNARREAEWIFCESLGLQRLELYTRFDMPVAADEVGRLRGLVQRRGRREPLAYVLGNQPFRQLSLQVGPGVLVPRPETEELVERIFAVHPADAARRLLDVGTGSGAIALACVSERPGWDVHATECSKAALAIARANGEALDLQVHWHQGHLAEAVTGTWDLLVANLPYIADSERSICDPELAHEPAEALFAADHGLSLIKELISDAPRLLGPEGELWLEHGWQQAQAIAQHAAAHGLSATGFQDGAGRDRYTCIRRAPA